MGPLSYYLGYNFVVKRKITSRGLVPVEELIGNIKLPARYPTELSWNDELRLLFPHFLTVNNRTRDANGQVVPTLTLMNSSKKKPFLFMSLVLQRALDEKMAWPDLTDVSRALEDSDGNVPDDIRGDSTRWRVCNMVKMPPSRQPYPVAEEVVKAIRERVSGLRLGPELKIIINGCFMVKEWLQ